MADAPARDDGPDPGAEPPRRRRRARTAERRRRRRAMRIRLGVLLVVLLAGTLVALVLATGPWDRLLGRPGTDGAGQAEPDQGGDRQPSLVLVTHDDTDPSGLATAVAVLAVDRETQRGTVLLVPAATVADVPGHGAFQLREAFAFGQGPLVAVTLDNLLDIRTDGVATLSLQGWSALLSRVDGFEVDVRSRLVLSTPDGGQVRFEPGRQLLEPPRLVEFLAFRQPGETELESLPRVQQVLEGLLDAIADDPATLSALLADGAPMVDVADVELLAVVLEELARARAADRVTTVTLPVSPLGTGREDLYRLDSARATALVDEILAASRPTEGIGSGRSVQILNGNGEPGIGQQVAERLSAGGYRIVLTGNADSFDHATTRIVVYSAGDDELATANDVRGRLGVGIIEQAATPQSVVDVTIIVGADFLP